MDTACDVTPVCNENNELAINMHNNKLHDVKPEGSKLMKLEQNTTR